MYEIPEELKSLYRHFNKHVELGKEIHSDKAEESFDSGLLGRIEDFASERMHVWNNRTRNNPKPYTTDEILKNYRFCNMYRELDKQTIRIHELLNPLRANFDVWLLNLFLCRFICNTDTIEKIGFLSYDKENNKQVYEKLLNMERPKYGSAYVFPISIIQRSDYPTRETFFCLYLPQVMKSVAKEIQTFDNVSVVEGINRVIGELGFNFKFHTTEILIDVAYQFPKYINLFDKFPIGPGSEPTMKMLSDGDPVETCITLASHKMKDFPYLTLNGESISLSAENWEGVGCEFRKYTNLSNGKGRKRKYVNT